MLAPASARAELAAAEITSLRVERADDGLYLSATLKFDLPSVVEDALLKGIPVSFVNEAQVLRDRWYWYDKRVATATRNVRLAYQPLTRRWRVSISSGTVTSAGSGVALSQNFDSLPEAMAVVQRIGKWKIAEPSDVETDARHNIDFRFRLDLTQLPRPFQIGALGQNDWSINAERNIRPEAAR